MDAASCGGSDIVRGFASETGNHRSFTEADENIFDLGLRRYRIVICVWCSGIAGFVRAGLDGSARRYAGARLFLALAFTVAPMATAFATERRNYGYVPPPVVVVGVPRACPYGFHVGPYGRCYQY